MLMSEYEMGIDQGERHLRERLVYRDRGLRRLPFLPPSVGPTKAEAC